MDESVLFACDKATLVKFMGILLKRMGLSMISAGDGAAALALIEVVNPDFVMVDADIAGFAGLDRLRRSNPGGPSSPPVMMLVGRPTAEAERRCLSSGATTVVTKPVRLNDFHFALQECMLGTPVVRRRHVRARVNIPVTVYHGGTEYQLTAESLSAGGAFIAHEQPVPVGERVDVFLPVGDDVCLFLSGEVIYNEKPCQSAFGICPGFAVSFVSPPQEEVRAIEDYVNSLMVGDIDELQVDRQREQVEHTKMYARGAAMGDGLVSA